MADFDTVATEYDQHFTESTIGRLQRDRVHQYFTRYFAYDARLDILELNGGTGEDALWLAEQGHQVTYSDISASMLEVAKAKHSDQQIDHSIVDLRRFHEFKTNKAFDLIFSNFGGINCVNIQELSDLDLAFARILKPDAGLILVVMPKETWLHRVYNIIKNRKEKKRSDKVPTEINVAGKLVNTYFFNHEDVVRVFPSFRCQDIIPISFLPSYFDQGMMKNRILSGILLNLDRLMINFRYLSNRADHFLIHLRKV